MQTPGSSCLKFNTRKVYRVTKFRVHYFSEWVFCFFTVSQWENKDFPSTYSQISSDCGYKIELDNSELLQPV